MKKYQRISIIVNKSVIYCTSDLNFFFVEVGQNVWCVIHNCDIQSSATTLKVSTLQKHIDSAIEYETDRSLHTVLPGMQFKFDIIKLSKNGLLGEFLNESKAYVHNMYLQKPLQSIHEFKEGQEVKGRVLYIEPITKFVFITLRGIETIAKTELKIGEILSSKVSYEKEKSLNFN